jgi:Uma2 family endonuclease
MVSPSACFLPLHRPHSRAILGENTAGHNHGSDATYHVGPRTGMRFLEGAPIFAIEVRSENDYGPAVERAMAQKRADYFVCGTQVVWDVDLQSQDVIKVYRASHPDHPTIYRRGDIAEAEPAVPGWRMPVDDLFG